jgi:hypothetical protein
MTTLLKSDFNLSKAAKNTWFISLQDGLTKEDLLNPSFYAHVAEKIRPQDTIEVVSKGNTFYAELFVLSSDKNSVKVSVLRWHNFKENNVDFEDNENYRIRYVANFGYQVIRVNDKKSMHDVGFNTKKEAVAFASSLAA